MQRIIVVLAVLGLSSAAVHLPNIFGDNMVLQTNGEYGARSFIWGTASPGEKVSITEGSSKQPQYVVNADQQGKWKVMLNPIRGNKPFDIVMSGETGPSVTLHKVLAGNVLLCSGQSNMQIPVSYVLNATATIAEADQYSNIRLFQVKQDQSATPKDDLNGTWVINSAKTVPPFSAVCYLTALWMSRMHWGKTPIGLVQSDWGGTPIQAWMSPDALQQCGEHNQGDVAVEKTEDVGGPGTPSQLYNAMIHPLVGMTVRAALWYQGEANVGQGRDAYTCNLGSLIQSWRDVWGIGDFAWLNVQLAPYKGGTAYISGVRLAETDVRPHPHGPVDTVGTAVIIDLGDPSGIIHPHNKTEVGRRMALQMLHVALAQQYPNLTFSGPEFKSAVQESTGNVVVNFDYADGMYWNDTHGCSMNEGCCSNYSAFEISADNVTWMKAEPKLGTSSVELIVPAGKAVKFVRLDISNFPGCALFNNAQLPATPFIKEVVSWQEEQVLREQDVRKTSPTYTETEDLTTPPMGFNSWNFYHCNIDERIVMKTADAFVEKGLAAAGYQYVNIDDCWQVQRDDDGNIVPDPVRFPSGMKALADYVHSKGLKFGLYTAQAEFTCQKRPGSWTHELQDAATYCEWGIDYLKIDHCGGHTNPHLNDSWILFKQGFDKCKQQTGKQIVMSVESCHDVTGCGSWIAKEANLWRTCGDIQSNWKSIMGNLDSNNVMAPVATPGHYNDPDMLQVGNSGVSLTEAKAHFSLWNIIMAPLLAGNDVLGMSNETVAILTAPEVVAINKDTLGKQGIRVSPANSTGGEVWARNMTDKSVAVALLNRGDETTNIIVTWDMISMPNDAKATVRDLWEAKDVGSFTGSFSSPVLSHEAVLVRITPAQANSVSL
eukprot:scpid34671/ scgid27197/ Alpha-galactosidase; Alpha-D-galactoside galactohydrolase; Melibiase